MTLQAPKTEVAQTPQKPVLENIQIPDAAFDVVEYFYPHMEYSRVLQLYMDTDDIKNIMNCSEDEAYVVFRNIRLHFGEEYLRVLVPHFCEYTGVDELFVHLFLIDLKMPKMLSKEQLSGLDYPGNRSIAQEQAKNRWQAMEKEKDGLILHPEALKQRTKEWHWLNPIGELMAKRLDKYRMVIYPDEVAAICRISLRTAQDMIRDIRIELKMERKLPVSIKKFCFYYPMYEEDEMRKGLAIMYGDDDDKEQKK